MNDIFVVEWRAQVAAGSHEEAASIALAMLRQKHNIATVFEVRDEADTLVVYDAAEHLVVKDLRHDA